MFDKKINELILKVVNTKIEESNSKIYERIVELEACIYGLQCPNGHLKKGRSLFGGDTIVFKYAEDYHIMIASTSVRGDATYYSTKINERYYIKEIAEGGDTSFYMVEKTKLLKIDMIDDDIATWYKQ